MIVKVSDLPNDHPAFKRVVEWKWKEKPDAIITSKIISDEIYRLESIRGINMCEMVKNHKLVNDLRIVFVYLIEKETPLKLKKWWFY